MLEPIRLNPPRHLARRSKRLHPVARQTGKLATLAEALNLELKFEAQEKNVGQFRAEHPLPQSR